MRPLDLKSVIVGAAAVLAGIYFLNDSKVGPCSYEMEDRMEEKRKAAEKRTEEETK